jgi:hypothetical protein
MSNDAIARLARQIDSTTRSERLGVNATAVASLRRQGAAELHHICAEFVASLNSRLSQAKLELSPASYTPNLFRESGASVLQISSQGRQMQITFQAPPELVSTQKFLIPYVLEGEARTYNQKMLERLEIRYMMLFYCVETDEASWRYYDWRTARTGPVDSNLLASLIEPLF